MSLEILKYPDKRLNEVSVKVEKFDTKLHQLLKDMAETMYASNGIGLAAPQVDHRLRVFVIDVKAKEESHDLHEFINPVLSDGQGKVVFEEGCLSLPGVTEEVQRFAQITVDYFDRHGKPKRLVAEDLFAVAIQHEYDHLDGTLFIEKLSPLKRKLLKRKLSKAVVL